MVILVCMPAALLFCVDSKVEKGQHNFNNYYISASKIIN